jgi:hypothetical protein
MDPNTLEIKTLVKTLRLRLFHRKTLFVKHFMGFPVFGNTVK